MKNLLTSFIFIFSFSILCIAQTNNNFNTNSESILQVSIIDDDFKDFSRLPVFFDLNSVSQILYYPYEVKYIGGFIAGLKFKSALGANRLNIPVTIWIGETDEVEFQYNEDNLFSPVEGWIPPENLTQVFNGTVDFFAGDGMEVAIQLDNPYQYTGKTLVLYIYKEKNDGSWTTNKNFYTSYHFNNNNIVIRSKYIYKDDTFELDPMNPPAGYVTYLFPDIILLIDVTELGAITGIITDETTGEAIEEVEMKIEDRFVITSDINGEYMFPNLNFAEHQISLSKFGYFDKTVIIEVAEQEPVTQNITLSPRGTYTVSGRITDKNGNKLEGVNIFIKGYADYSGTTNFSGDYSISGVYEGDFIYRFAATKQGYIIYTGTVEVNGNNITYNFILDELVCSAGSVSVSEIDDNAVVEWTAPNYLSEFRHDSGNIEGWTGFAYGLKYSLLGSAHRVSATLSKMSWLTLNKQNPPVEELYLWVLGLDENGIPDKNSILFYVENVPAQHGQWAEYEFPEPVHAPFGFFIALSGVSAIFMGELVGAFIGLGTDLPNEEYPFMYNTHYFIGHLLHPQYEFNPLENNFGYPIYKNYMVRAEGTSYGELTTFGYGGKEPAQSFGFDLQSGVIQPGLIENVFVDSTDGIKYTEQNPSFEDKEKVFSTSDFSVLNSPQIVASDSKFVQDYTIYRLKKDDPEDKWITIAENIPILTFTDKSWSTLPWGEYQYAVSAVYESGASKATLSNVLPKDMLVDFQINIKTNSGVPATGAFIKLTNNKNNLEQEYSFVSGADGILVTDIWKSHYNLLIWLEGYEKFEVTGWDITNAGQEINVTLTEVPLPVRSLTAEIADNQVFIEWEEPKLVPITYRYDDGSAEAALTINDPGESMGNEYYVKEDGIITSIDVLLFDAGWYIKRPVIIDIYDDDRKLIYSTAPLMPIFDWINFIIDYVSYSDKFYVMVKWPAGPYYFLGLDKTGAFADGTRAWHIDFFGQWVSMSSYPSGYSGIFMIRVNALSAGKTISYGSKCAQGIVDLPQTGETINAEIYYPSTTVPECFPPKTTIEKNLNVKNYTVYRFIEGQAEENWKKLSDNVTGNEFTDISWNMLPVGSYQYAVKAVYETGLSAARISKVLTKNTSDYYPLNSLSGLTLSPNPFTNEINVSNPALVKSVEITNIAGQKIKNIVFDGKSIMTEKLAGGVYFVTIENISGGKGVYKMIKSYF